MMVELDRGEPPPIVFWSLLAPAAAWFTGAAAIVLASVAGFPALAVPADLTLAEAAAIRDEAEVLKRIRSGADPNVPALVRRGIISDPEYLLTPLEAATAAGHVEVVRLLVANGAALNARNFPVLYCLAQTKEAADIVAVLKEHAPPGAIFNCDNVRLPL